MHVIAEDYELMQLIFDKVWERSKHQVKAMDGESGMCCYRCHQGEVLPWLPCFIGAIIKDEFYSRSLEGKDVNTFDVRQAIGSSLKASISGSTVGFLNRLQEVHDFHPPELWDEKLLVVAKDYGLAFPPA